MCREHDMARAQFSTALIRANHTVAATPHVRDPRLFEDMAAITNDLFRESLKELLRMKLRLSIDTDGSQDREREIGLSR